MGARCCRAQVLELRGGVRAQEVEEPLQVVHRTPNNNTVFVYQTSPLPGIAAASFAGTAPAGNWRFGEAARSACASPCSAPPLPNRQPVLTLLLPAPPSDSPLCVGSELGYNYEVPVRLRSRGLCLRGR